MYSNCKDKKITKYMTINNATDHINRIKLTNKYTKLDILYTGSKRAK